MGVICLSGQRFGRLVVLRKSERSTAKRTYWHCLCDCGSTCEPRVDALRAPDGPGSARSCGCLQKQKAAATGRASRRHQYKGTRIYNSWQHMIDRCTNPNNKKFHHYGGRGIEVCSRWRENFLHFLGDMSPMPDGKTLERRDNSLGYSKENCFWADYTQQNRNRRGSIMISLGGGDLHANDYAERQGVSRDMVNRQIRLGSLSAYKLGGASL